MTDFYFYILIFAVSISLLVFSGNLLIGALARIARFLGWKEFVVAFILMAMGSSLPNLFVGVSSALHKIPQLSLGDIIGGNVVVLTLAAGLAVFFSKGGIPAESRTIQSSSFFTLVAAFLPMLLIFDGRLERSDGILLVGFFAFYCYWLFSKEERFRKVYDKEKVVSVFKDFQLFLRDLGRLALGMFILFAASEGIVRSARFFAEGFNVPIILVGILIVGFGNALPETYFAIASARRGESWMILGNLMGSVVITATLVLGTVALICPVEIVDFSPFAIARFFLIFSISSFFFFVRSGQKITRKEGVFLLAVYVVFVAVEILLR